jgi:hypothetical protein
VAPFSRRRESDRCRSGSGSSSKRVGIRHVESGYRAWVPRRVGVILVYRRAESTRRAERGQSADASTSANRIQSASRALAVDESISQT